MSLERDIRAVKKGLVEGIERSIGEMALSTFSAVVLATPVDTGRARGNWQPSFGEPATTATENRDKGGGTTIAKGNGLFARYEFGKKIFLTNNVPYIQRLNEGHSSQARPAGFVQRAIIAGIANLERQGDLFS